MMQTCRLLQLIITRSHVLPGRLCAELFGFVMSFFARKQDLTFSWWIRKLRYHAGQVLIACTHVQGQFE